MTRTCFVLLTLFSACTERVEPLRVPTQAESEPGSGGRPVLWLTPRAHVTVADAATAALADANVATEDGVLAVRALLDDPQPAVRAAAAKALAGAERESAAFGLLLAAADPHPAVAQAALDALRARAVDRRRTLFDHAMHAEPRVARAAAAVVHEVLSESVDSVVAVFKDASVDVLARATLLRTCPATLLTAADELPGDTDVAIRAAMEACTLGRQLGFTPEPMSLLAALKSDDRDTRLLAARALFDLGPRLGREHGASVREALTLAARTTDPDVSVAVAAARIAFGDPTAFGMLAAFAGGGSGAARLGALQALHTLAGRTGKLANDELGPVLLSPMDDDDPAIRALAVAVAGATGDGRVSPALVRHLRDPDDAVRAAAAYAIGQVGAKPAIEALIEIGIDDRVKDVRDAAFASLHHLVHDLPLPPASMVASWLADPGPVKPGTFWGTDRERWRQWYQLER